MPGLIGPRLWTPVVTALHRSKATNAVTVDAAGPERLNMSHTRNTRLIHQIHEAWAVKNGYRPKLQAPSFKLDRSSGLGYSRINGKVQQRSRFVGPSHITNKRHAHLVRSSTRAARQDPGLPVDSNVLMVMERPGDRDTQPENLHAENTNRFGKVQAPSLSYKLKSFLDKNPIN